RVFISNANKCNWLRSYKKPINVYVSLPNIEHIINQSSGSITSNGTLTYPNFHFHHYGNGNVNIQVNVGYLWINQDHYGDLTISGYAANGEALIQNVGHYFAAGLKTKEFIINNFDAGQAYVECDSSLRAVISGAGNIYYSGAAAVNFTSIGTGNLIKQ